MDSVWLLKIPAFSSLDRLRETTTLNLKLLSYFRGLIHIASWSWQDAQEGPKAEGWTRRSSQLTKEVNNEPNLVVCVCSAVSDSL